MLRDIFFFLPSFSRTAPMKPGCENGRSYLSPFRDLFSFKRRADKQNTLKLGPASRKKSQNKLLFFFLFSPPFPPPLPCGSLDALRRVSHLLRPHEDTSKPLQESTERDASFFFFSLFLPPPLFLRIAQNKKRSIREDETPPLFFLPFARAIMSVIGF